MNLRDLRYLLAVNKHKHFGKAAEESFVSQPALSMQLKKLEEELGVRLFERSQKNMLTAIGEAIIPLAQAIVMQVESIKDMAKTAHKPFSGQLKLGAFPTLAPYIFPKVVKKIKERLPDLTLLLVEEKTEVLLQQLSRGELDAALLALPVAQKNFS